MGTVSYGDGAAMHCDMDLELVRSSFEAGIRAIIGEFEISGTVNPSNWSRNNILLSNSWMTVIGDLQAAVNGAEASFSLDRGFLDIAGAATFNPGAEIHLNLAGPTRTTKNNVMAGGALYSGIDIGTLVLAGGSLSLSIENGPLTEPAYELFRYGALAGTFTSVSGIPAGYTIDYAYNGNSIALVTGSTPPIVTETGPGNPVQVLIPVDTTNTNEVACRVAVTLP
jgi:hypothetical protein